MKECVISFANNRGNYYKALARLRQSMSQFWNGDFLGFTDEWSIGAPLHVENPYAFKIYCFRAALQAGYRKILYVDSSVFAVANVTPVFDIIKRDGYIMQESGAYIRDWIGENQLKYFGLTKDVFGNAVMYGNAGLLGLDFDNEKARTFFEKWEAAMEAGIFKGSWAEMRHDMSAGSVIAWLMHMDKNYQKGDQILEYAAPEDPIKNGTIIFKAQGL